MGLLSFFSSKPTNTGRSTSKKYRLKNYTIVVEVENVDNSGLKAYTEIFSKKRFLSQGIISEELAISSVSEFFTDVDFIIAFMNKAPELNNKVSLEALAEACRNHIKKFGRLIDIDLKSYSYALMHVLNALNIAKVGRPIAEETGVKFSMDLREIMTYDFVKFMWTYVQTPAGEKLTKLTDIEDLPYFYMK